jgi:uncharacterized protein DUF1565
MFMKSTSSRIGVTLLAALVLGPASAAPARAATSTLYVTPTGSDTAAGTSAAPLKTLGAALGRATGGERIELAPGSYPLARDTKVRTTDVLIAGAGTGSTSVAGLEIFGGQHLRFFDMRFTGPVTIQGHPTKHAAQPATAVAIGSSEFTTSGTCLTIKEGSQEVSLVNSWLHGCYSGVVGPGNPYISRGIQITGNTIEQIKSDGIQFGAWSDVDIADNVIRDVKDPAGVIHNDGIQMTGSSADVRIERNDVRRSGTQLIFIQDAIGPIDHVDVVDNLLATAPAVALQSQGATRSSFINNTIWDAKDGGLWIRAGYVRNGVSVVPTDTVMVNNLATTIRVMEGAVTATSAGNVMQKPSYSGVAIPAGTVTVADPGFVARTAGDYRLSATSAARPLGSWTLLPDVDLTGETRTAAVPGAYN